jgi:hypothetical protein
MKKIIIFSLMLVSALSVDAQRKRTRTATSQGNVVVRLGMGINTTKSDPDLDLINRTATINFTPSVGYMVVDNLELGVDLSINNTWGENVFTQSPVVDKDLTNATNVGFGVYVQKYFPLNNWFAFTTKVDLGLSTGTYSEDNVNGSITTPTGGVTSGVGGAVNFGFAFTPYNAFSLQANIAGLGVNSSRNDPDGVAPLNPTVNTTEFGFNVRRQTSNLSLVWFFGRGLWKKN